MRAWHPPLFALFPVLSLYVSTAHQTAPGDALRAAAACLVSALVLWAALAAALRDARKGALLATAALVLFFSYGHLFGTRGKSPLALAGRGPFDLHPAMLAALGLLWAGLAVRVARTRRGIEAWTRGLNVAGAALAVGAAVQLAAQDRRTTPREDAAAAALAAFALPEGELAPGGGLAPPKPAPDVYYVVLDGYGRTDAVRRFHGFDDSAFVDALRARGFYVDDGALANYMMTYYAIASALNFEYVNRLTGVLPPGYRGDPPLAAILHESRVEKLLRRAGYRFAAFATPYGPTTIPDADLRLSYPFALNEFENVLLGTTAVAGLAPAYQYDLFRRETDFGLRTLGTLGGEERPTFVFLHSSAPHPPFVFAADGGPAYPEPLRPFSLHDASAFLGRGGTEEEYSRGYAAQMRHVNRRVLEAVDLILARAPKGRPPIVVIHGDHGPRMRSDWGSLEKTDVRESFPILLALHLPGFDPAEAPRPLTPVNLFRIVFNHAFGTRLPPLPARHYVAVESPYDFIDVTERVSAIDLGSGEP